MNQLACFIHSLVSDTDEDDGQLSTLSQGEQAAIIDLKPLLALSPPELSAYLEDGPTVEWWV